MAEAYRDQNVERRVEGTGNVVEWLDEQIKDLKPRLEASEMALYDYRKKNDMLTASLEDRQNIVSQKLLDLNKTLTDLRTKRIELQSKIEEIQSLKASSATDPNAYDSLPEVAQQPAGPEAQGEPLRAGAGLRQPSGTLRARSIPSSSPRSRP